MTGNVTAVIVSVIVNRPLHALARAAIRLYEKVMPQISARRDAAIPAF